jgi:uncharacterized protein YuzE
MKTHYDSGADAVHISFVDAPSLDSEEVAPGIVIDYDAEGRIVALEVLSASRRLAPGALPPAAE